MDIDSKRKFIYENIDFINDQNEINNFIILNNIKYSENNNGLFINISILSEDIINNLFFLIENIINNKDEKTNITDIKLDIKKNEIINKISTNIINDILLKDFTNDQKNIIRLSKTFKFE